MDKNFWYAVSILIGTIVGAGMFALPYVSQKAGFLIGVLYIVTLFFVFLALHLMMSEVALRTEKKHRFIGYVGEYFGKTAKDAVMITSILGVFGGLLAYILISGNFLHLLSGSIFPSVGLNEIYFWLSMSVILLFGIKALEKSEVFMLVFLLAAILLMAAYSLPRLNVQNLAGLNPSNFFLPYGPAMYALAGVAAIPILRDILKGEESKMKKAIFIGTLIPAILYIMFIFLVVGVTDGFVTEDALTGLSRSIGQKAIVLGALFGLLAIATSYLSFSFYLKQTFIYDLHVSEKKATALVILFPLLLVSFMPVGFIDVVIFLGAVFGGIEAIILVKLFKKAKEKSQRVPEYSVSIPKLFIYFMLLLFFVGIIYEISSMVK